MDDDVMLCAMSRLAAKVLNTLTAILALIGSALSVSGELSNTSLDFVRMLHSRKHGHRKKVKSKVGDDVSRGSRAEHLQAWLPRHAAENVPGE